MPFTCIPNQNSRPEIRKVLPQIRHFVFMIHAGQEHLVTDLEDNDSVLPTYYPEVLYGTLQQKREKHIEESSIHTWSQGDIWERRS